MWRPPSELKQSGRSSRSTKNQTVQPEDKHLRAASDLGRIAQTPQQGSSISTGVVRPNELKPHLPRVPAAMDVLSSSGSTSEDSNQSEDSYSFAAPCKDPTTHPPAARVPNSGWLKEPSDPAGTLVNLSDRPSLCMSIHGTEAAVGSSDHAVYTIDVKTCRLSRILYGKSHGHTEWVTCIDHLPDGRIISGGMDNKLCLWDKYGVRSSDLKGHSASISAVKAGLLSQAEYIAISASYDKSLLLWNVGGRIGKEIGRLVGHKEAVMDFVASSNGRLTSGARDGSVILWDVNAKLPLLHCRRSHKGQVSALEVLEGCASELFLSGGQDGVLHAWDFRYKNPVHSTTLHRSKKGVGALNCIRVTNGTPCGCPLIVTAGADRLVKVLDVRASFKVLHTLTDHTDFIYSLHVKGSTAWSGGGDGSLLLHELVSGKCLYGLGATEKGAVRGICSAGEGQAGDKLAVTGDDGNVMIYSF